MSKALDKRFERYERLLSELIGPIEEWTTEELERFLADAGIDSEGTQRLLYSRVDEIAGRYRLENKNVPEHVADFLRQMRPADLQTSDPVVAQSVARAWITKVLGRGPILGVPQVAHAFRNRQGEIDPEDQALLEGLEAKLKKRRKQEE
jgi:hypothetical protein